MKNLFKIFIFMLVPTVVIWAAMGVAVVAVPLLTLYLLTTLLTIWYVFIFFRNRWVNLFILPLSFALSGIAIYSYEYFQGSGFLQYLFTYAVAFYYSGPFFVITMIISIVMFIRSKAKKRKADVGGDKELG